MTKVTRVAFVFVVSCALSVANAQTNTLEEKLNKDYSGFAQRFLTNHCGDCHGEAEPEGNLSLHDLGPVDEVNSATWKSVWAQVTLKEMPPKDADQPKTVERLQFSDWIVGELSRVMRDKGGFRAHLDPNKGNYVDHELLFGPLPDGSKLIPTSSPARIWRVTPQEHFTRLNELINREPEYDPEKPGLRTWGDAVPANGRGELSLYFGTDRIIQWQGKAGGYALSIKSLPTVLSSARDRGLENYPDLYTVNSAEATQVMDVADDIIRYMAHGPLSIAEPYQITDDPKSIADKMKGDLRGLPTALVYSTKVVRPLTPVYDFMNSSEGTGEQLRAAVDFLFEALTFRPPAQEESDRYVAIVKRSIEKLGKEDGAVLGLSSIFLDRDALFRAELVENGQPDRHGRIMLQDWELGLAVNHALRYIKPDEKLRKAIIEGRMRNRADVKREVERMLADDSIRKPRILRFFRDYFDYDLGGYICKDTEALASTGVAIKRHYRAMFDATASTDRLIQLILEEDKDVFKQLLTTDKVVAAQSDKVYFGKQRANEEKQLAVSVAKEQAKTNESELEAAEKEVAELEAKLKANSNNNRLKKALAAAKKKKAMAAKKKASDAKKLRRPSFRQTVEKAKLSGPKIYARVSRLSRPGTESMAPERILASAPEGQRLGILTHPSWLVSHSDAMDNHAILRGRWIRERLLGGSIPDVPITVDAMLPDEPNSTLRERMRGHQTDVLLDVS